MHYAIAVALSLAPLVACLGIAALVANALLRLILRSMKTPYALAVRAAGAAYTAAIACTVACTWMAVALCVLDATALLWRAHTTTTVEDATLASLAAALVHERVAVVAGLGRAGTQVALHHIHDVTRWSLSSKACAAVAGTWSCNFWRLVAGATLGTADAVVSSS